MYREYHAFSLVDLLQKSAARKADAQALADEGASVSYGTLYSRVEKLALALIEAGLQPGDRVGFCFPNSIDYVISHYAVMRAGGVSVPLDSFITPGNLSYQLRNTDARFLLFDQSHWDKMSKADLPSIAFAAVNGMPGAGEPSFLKSPVRLFDDIFRSGLDGRLPRIDPDGMAMILYTTGTTGRAKGVTLTHRNLVISAMNIMERCDVTEDDCELTALPQTRLFGLAHVHGYLSLGGRMMLMKNMILPQKVLPQIEAVGATSFPHVPTAFHILMNQYPDLLRQHASRLRYILMCSAPCKPDMYRSLKAMLPGVRIFHSYGLTEAARSTIIELDRYPDKLDSVGPPTPGTSISIVSEGRPVPAGQQGEVIIRGPIVTPGYWKREDENRQTFTEHGFRSGDLGYLDDDGFLFLIGRIKDIINVSGLKVNPVEIEDALNTHPDIMDTGVVGIPDDQGPMNEKIVAFVVMREDVSPDGKMLRDYLLDRLENYKIPVQFIKIDALPKTVSGKIQRNKLREKVTTAGDNQ